MLYCLFQPTPLPSRMHHFNLKPYRSIVRDLLSYPSWDTAECKRAKRRCVISSHRVANHSFESGIADRQAAHASFEGFEYGFRNASSPTQRNEIAQRRIDSRAEV